jgi:magnesium transporter
MPRFLHRSAGKAGAAPGTPIYVGRPREEPLKVSVLDYSADQCDERETTAVDSVFPLRDTPTITWINVDGVQHVDAVQALGEHFGLHPLVIEDIVHTGQRPKAEEYGDVLYVVVRMLRWDEPTHVVLDEQVSLVVGPTWVLSFQERQGDVFDAVRERIRTARGRIRGTGPDYLAYAMLDAVVDGYFAVLEHVGEVVEALGEEITLSPDQKKLEAIRRAKRELLFLRKSVWPLREVIGGIQRGEYPLIRDSTLPYLRDLYDHTIQVIDTVETFRDMIVSVLDVYLSSLSNRMNEVMKVLTVIATIFMPLSFIVGLYGMNFLNMPELSWRYGYFVVLGVIAAIAGGMLVYFRRRRWL